jgi:hypothetical protein
MRYKIANEIARVYLKYKSYSSKINYTDQILGIQPRERNPLSRRKAMLAVSEWALAKRINRQLGQCGEKLIKSRGEGPRAEVGDWYVLNTAHNFVVLHHVNVEGLAKELGVLSVAERLNSKVGGP